MTDLTVIAAQRAAASPLPNQPGAASSATGSQASGGTAASHVLADLGQNFDRFITLLTAQLQHQDPTSPMDTNAFTTELVQFTGVQAQENTNQSLQSLIGLTQQGQLLQTAQLAGRQVRASSDAITLQNGHGAIGFTLPAAGDVSVAVVDSAGRLLRSASVAGNAGDNVWHWDGAGDNGVALPDGAYRVAVVAGSGNANAALPVSVIGTVTALTQGAGGMQVSLGALSLPLSAVQSVGQ